MKIKITFQGAAKEYSTSEAIELEMNPTATVADTIPKIIEKQPKVENISKYLFVSVNNALVSRNTQLSENDELSLFFRSGGG